MCINELTLQPENNYLSEFLDKMHIRKSFINEKVQNMAFKSTHPNQAIVDPFHCSKTLSKNELFQPYKIKQHFHSHRFSVKKTHIASRSQQIPADPSRFQQIPADPSRSEQIPDHSKWQAAAATRGTNSRGRCRTSSTTSTTRGRRRRHSSRRCKIRIRIRKSRLSVKGHDESSRPLPNGDLKTQPDSTSGR